MPHGRAHLGEVPDRVPDLLVEEDSIGHDDNGVEGFLLPVLQPNELVGEPGDRVGLAAASRMLDQVPLARPLLGGVGQEFPHHVKLMIAWEDLGSLLFARLVVLTLDDLGVILKDVGQSLGSENPFPEVIRLESVGIGRIARPIVPPLVERQEPRALALQVGAKPDLMIVHGEVSNATAKLEDEFAWVAVTLILLDGIFDGLLGEAVLEFKGCDR